jgi:hypothetical protein
VSEALRRLIARNVHGAAPALRPRPVSRFEPLTAAPGAAAGGSEGLGAAWGQVVENAADSHDGTAGASGVDSRAGDHREDSWRAAAPRGPRPARAAFTSGDASFAEHVRDGGVAGRAVAGRDDSRPAPSHAVEPARPVIQPHATRAAGVAVDSGWGADVRMGREGPVVAGTPGPAATSDLRPIVEVTIGRVDVRAVSAPAPAAPAPAQPRPSRGQSLEEYLRAPRGGR